MITLAKIPLTQDGSKRSYPQLQEAAGNVYHSSGLYHALKSGGDFHGYLTVEDTPGHYNYNKQNKLAKVVYYKNDVHTRRGYHVKLEIGRDGDLITR